MSTLTSRYRGLGRLPRVGLSLVGGVGLVLMGLATGATSVGATSVNGTSAYTPLASPCRIVDTRLASPINAQATMVSPEMSGTVECFTTYSGTGSPTPITLPAGVTSVVVNATVVSPNYFGYLSLYPFGGASTVSNLNFSVNQTVANLVTVGVSASSATSPYAFDFFDGQPSGSSGNVQVVLDLEGYYAAPATNAGYYVPLTPVRVADTRTGSGLYGAGLPLGTGNVMNVPIAGAASTIPATANISAVVVNLTAVTPSTGTYLSAYAFGTTLPNASNLNPANGETVANRVIVAVGSNGEISIYNSLGTVQVVVDVDGYYTTNVTTLPAGASLFTPLAAPVRIADTRTGSGLALAGSHLAANGAVSVAAAGVGTVSAFATALAANVTEVNSQGTGDFTVYPGGSAPNASDLNFISGQTVPNFTQATLSSTGAISIFNSNTGTADAFVDVFGFFAPASVGSVTVTPTTAAQVVQGATATYKAVYTIDGAAYLGTGTAQNVAVFSDALANPGTQSLGMIEDVYTEAGGVPNTCWELADGTGADCPAAATNVASGTAHGGATVTGGAYNLTSSADSYAYASGTGTSTLWVIVGNNPTGGPGATGLGNVNLDAYINANSALTPFNFVAGEPMGVGGVITFVAPAATNAALAVTNAGGAYGTNDTFTNGDFYAGLAATYTATPSVVNQSGTAFPSAAGTYTLSGVITNNTGSSLTVTGAGVSGSPATVAAGGTVTYSEPNLAASANGAPFTLVFATAPSSVATIQPASITAQLSLTSTSANIGTTVSNIVNWANTSAAAALDNVNGTGIVTWDATAVTAGGVAVSVLTNTAIGPYLVQFNQGIASTYTVSGTTTTEAVFAGSLAVGLTYLITSYDTATQTNAIN